MWRGGASWQGIRSGELEFRARVGETYAMGREQALFWGLAVQRDGIMGKAAVAHSSRATKGYVCVWT